MRSDPLHSSREIALSDFMGFPQLHSYGRGFASHENEGLGNLRPPFKCSGTSNQPNRFFSLEQPYARSRDIFEPCRDKLDRNSMNIPSNCSYFTNSTAKVTPTNQNMIDTSTQQPFLQCLRVGCPYMFRTIIDWTSHTSFCSQSQVRQDQDSAWLQCPFIACGRLLTSVTSLHDHYSQWHLVYVCSKESCRAAFEQKPGSNHHQYAEESVCKHDFQASLLLEPKNWSLEQVKNGRPMERNAYIPFNPAFMGSLPTVTGDTDDESCRDIPMSRTESSVSSIPQPVTPRITGLLPGSSPQISDDSRPLDSTILQSPSSLQMALVVAPRIPEQPVAKPFHGSCQQPGMRPRRMSEPPAITTLGLLEQKPYLTALLNICTTAAYSFYIAHTLSCSRDKKFIPIFLTKDKTIARLPYDLTLPQWTQNLRKACDTRHIDESMVYCLESFKGEIQPVDEVRHALMKEKLKSDRSLLALIEAARTFVKQLKDWERCEMVDSLYDEVETMIRERKAQGTFSTYGGTAFGSDHHIRRSTWY